MTPPTIAAALRSEFTGALRGAFVGFGIAVVMIGVLRFVQLLFLYEGLPPSLESLIADEIVSRSTRGTHHYSVSSWLMMSALLPLAILGIFSAEALKVRSRARRITLILERSQAEAAQLLPHGTEKGDGGKTQLLATLEFENAPPLRATFSLRGTRAPASNRASLWRDGPNLVLATESDVLEGRVAASTT